MSGDGLKVGINMYATDTGPDWTRLVQRAEMLGYDVLTLSDHIAGLINREFSRFAPIPALAAAASVTKRIRFSMFVLCNDFRHPGALAKDIATLDVLSEGRIELGLGAGWDATEFGELGIPFDAPAVRVARMYESVRLLRELWDSRAPVTFAGEHYRITDFEVFPRPVQAKIPIMVGGGGPTMLRRAARYADIISLMTFNGTRTDSKLGGKGATLEAVKEQLSWIKEAAGDRYDELTINCRANIFCLTDDRDAAARRMAPGAGFEVDELLHSPYALIGTHRQMADQILRQRDELGIPYVALNQPALDEFAPVIEMLRA